ncbi:MAG: hypothetical protein V1784_04115 [bacterium]
MTGLRRAVFGTRLRAGAFGALAGVLALALFVTLLEAIFRLPGEGRYVLLALWLLGSLAALGVGILWPLAKRLFAPASDEKLAGFYADRMPSIRDRVLNALQLLKRVDDNREGYSVDLILEAGRDVAEDLKPISPRDLPDKRPVRLFGRALLVSSAFAGLMFALFGGALVSAGERVLRPDEEFAPPAPFDLVVRPGSCTVLRGDSLAVIVKAIGKAPSEITLERLERGKVASEPVTLKGNGEGEFRYTYRGIASAFAYWAFSGTVETERYQVDVRELPAVRSLSVRLAPPSYTRMDEKALEENVGDISALYGTTARLSISATKPLRRAFLEFFDGKPSVAGEEPQTQDSISLAVSGFKASGEFKVRKSGSYRIRLVDTENLADRDPILYRIAALPDEIPVVTLVEPAKDMDVAAGVQVPVICEATDDFGFTRMTLRYHRTSALESDTGTTPLSSFEKIDLTYESQGRAKIRSEYKWDLTPLDLLPEDQVEFFVEVWDNDVLTGPKRAESVHRMLRFPSMQEIFEAQEQAEKARHISVKDLLDRSRELGEEIDRAMEEYKSNPEMSWERKQELQQMIQEQEAMTQLLEDIAQALQKTAEQMEARALFSPETLEKFQELQKLIQEVITPEMREALRKLQEAMQQANEDQFRKAMENFSMTQEQFQEALDRTLNILKQLQVEQKMDEITRRLDELANRQDKLNEAQEKASPQDAEKLASEQEKLAEEMRNIEQQSRELEKLMRELQNTPKSEMAQFNQQMQEENIPQEMQQNAQGLSACQQSSCRKRGRKISRELTDMANTMRNMKKQMVQQQLAAIQEQLEKAQSELLRLSERQEDLWDETQGLPSTSPQMSQVGEDQQDISSALGRISQSLMELARQTLFVTPQIRAAMWEASQKMEQALAAARNRDPRTAAHHQRQAMAALNKAQKEVSSSSSNCSSSCNSATGMNQMCNKAGGMAGQQMAINQQTEMLMDQGNPGALSMGEAATIQRLAEQQEALAKAADELASEAAAARQTLGRLGDMGQEMREVAQDLRDRNVTMRTRERQERIVSRLLDFQRSAREREFKPQRRARTGTDVVRASPPQVSPEAGKDQLREDLLRALDAKFARDYEILIRQYFDALGKMQSK